MQTQGQRTSRRMCGLVLLSLKGAVLFGQFRPLSCTIPAGDVQSQQRKKSRTDAGAYLCAADTFDAK